MRALTALLALGSSAKPAPNERASCLVASTHSSAGFPGSGCVWIPTAQRAGRKSGRERCTPSRWTDASAAPAFSNCSLAEIAARHMPEPIPTISRVPTFLWSDPGHSIRLVTGEKSELFPLDLFLAEPVSEDVEPADYDLANRAAQSEEPWGPNPDGVPQARSRGDSRRR